jgi:hypothetical protein
LLTAGNRPLESLFARMKHARKLSRDRPVCPPKNRAERIRLCFTQSHRFDSASLDGIPRT